MSMKMIKFMHAAQELPKVIKVCLSCTTEAHCEIAMRYIARFVTKHRVCKQSVSLSGVVHALMRYLQDTRDHANCGYHYAEHDAYKMNRVWPDLNDYIGNLMGIKLPRSWSKNCKLHMGEIPIQ